MRMWQKLGIKGKILIPICLGFAMVIGVIAAVGGNMLHSEKTSSAQLRNQYIARLFEIAEGDRRIQMEKAVDILVNTDEVIRFLEEPSAGPQVKMVLEGVMLTIGQNNGIRRYSLYDTNLNCVSQHSEKDVPELPGKLDGGNHGPFLKTAEEYDYRPFYRTIANGDVTELEHCLVTVVTNDDDDVVGFVEVATEPDVLATAIRNRTGGEVAFLGDGTSSFAAPTSVEIYSGIAPKLPSDVHETPQSTGHFQEFAYLADKLSVTMADGTHLGRFWIINDDSANARAQKRALLVGGAVVLVAILGIIGALVFLLGKSIVNPLAEIMKRLSSASGQVSSASSQVAGTSVQLAGRSSEQAASLQEASASLMDLSSQTEKNSQSARNADQLMEDTLIKVSQGMESTHCMIETINAIKASSDETAKIINTINEIAFQTNLLALNAAVEAARAGDYGKGFAVVAEEVRNLALRSQEAATSTAQLLEEAQSQATNGVKVVGSVSEGLASIQEGTQTCGGLVAGIASAAKEQSLVIKQVNQAVAEIDQVVQQSAANAEESASTGEELSGQANELSGLVGELTGIVQGH